MGELTVVVLELSCPGRDIRDLSILFTSRIAMAIPLLPGWLMCSSLERVTSHTSHFPRARVSSCLLLRRETRGLELSRLLIYKLLIMINKTFSAKKKKKKKSPKKKKKKKKKKS